MPLVGDGPPKWVPFGQKLAKGKEGGGKEKPTENGSVPALGGMKEKSVEEEDNSEFVAQRNNAIEGNLCVLFNTSL